MSATFAVIIGAVLSLWYEGRARRMSNPERALRLGTLVASGLIVGESIWGVINAGLIVGFAKDAPIALVPGDFCARAVAGGVRLRRRDRVVVRVDAEAVESGAVSLRHQASTNSMEPDFAEILAIVHLAVRVYHGVLLARPLLRTQRG
jgi:hypothetical protein